MTIESGINNPISAEIQKKANNPKFIHKYIYYLIQMFISFAQNLNFQFVPIYNRKLGANETQMGLLTSVQNVFTSLFSPYWGKKSDRYGRRGFLIIGSLFAISSAVAIALAKDPEQVIFAVAVNSFALSIIIPAWTGALADVTEGKSRGGFVGRVLGVGAGWVTLALIIFAVVSPKIRLDDLMQYKIIMWILAINFIIVFIFSLFYIDIKKNKQNKLKNSIFTPLRDRTYRRFIVVVMFWWFWMSLAWSYFPIVISDKVKATPGQVAWIGIASTAVQAFGSYRLGGIIDRIGIKKSVVIGFLPFFLIPVTYALSVEWYQIFIPQILAGIGTAFGFTALQVYIIETAGSEKAANYQGTYQIIWGIVTFTGSFLGGLFLTQLKFLLSNLDLALTYALITVSILRLLSNIALYKFLPDIEKRTDIIIQ